MRSSGLTAGNISPSPVPTGANVGTAASTTKPSSKKPGDAVPLPSGHRLPSPDGGAGRGVAAPRAAHLDRQQTAPPRGHQENGHGPEVQRRPALGANHVTLCKICATENNRGIPCCAICFICDPVFLHATAPIVLDFLTFLQHGCVCQKHNKN